VSKQWPVIVLGGSGYVAGEMLRLVSLHPDLKLAAVGSSSQAGEPVAGAFGHLKSSFPDLRFASLDTIDALLEPPAGTSGDHFVLLSAAPHGASAALVADFLDAASSRGQKLTIVDASADFRFRQQDVFEDIYATSHAAPSLIDVFQCAVPEQLPSVDTPHAAHPGCFATSMLLGIVPLLAAGLAGEDFCVSAVTGSTGAGRGLRETTHHPVRQSNLFAYQALAHRHTPEVRTLTRAATGRGISLHFVPHSGPFARGIHATIFAKMARSATHEEVREALADYYADAPFVSVSDTPPRMKDIAGSNFAVLGSSVDEDTIVVYAVLDNLLKGAAGGCIQWVNRLLGLPDARGLSHPAAGWL
jgi:N-acetyl-gamma-glutamyl-phosphate reductase common form